MEKTVETAPVVVKQEERNGVVRPKPETACGRIWAKADEMSAAAKGPVACVDLINALTPLGYVEPTIRTQYARWRKFYNVTGRVVSESKALAEAAKLAEKEAKKADREAAKQAKAAEKEAKKAEREAAKVAKAKEAAEKKAAAAEAKARKEAEAEAAKQAKAAETAQGAAQ